MLRWFRTYASNTFENQGMWCLGCDWPWSWRGLVGFWRIFINSEVTQNSDPDSRGVISSSRYGMFWILFTYRNLGKSVTILNKTHIFMKINGWLLFNRKDSKLETSRNLRHRFFVSFSMLDLHIVTFDGNSLLFFHQKLQQQNCGICRCLEGFEHKSKDHRKERSTKHSFHNMVMNAYRCLKDEFRLPRVVYVHCVFLSTSGGDR